MIAEIIKSNADDEQRRNFTDYLVSKIINEGYFKSSLIKQLIKLSKDKIGGDDGDNTFLKNVENQEESSNQQFILKKIIRCSKFRELMYMKKS